MKHLNKILTGAAVLVLLTGCDLFKHSISKEDYQAKVDKLKEHQYTEATVSLKEEIKGTGMYAESTADTDETAKFTYDETLGWATEDVANVSLKYYIFTLQGKKIDDSIAVPDESSLEINTTYYSNLEVKTEIKGTYVVDSSLLHMEIEYDKYTIDYKFDKYGWLTNYKMVCNSSVTAGDESGTNNTTRIVKISYK